MAPHMAITYRRIMLVDALPPEPLAEFDLCIVGAGPIGISIAKAFEGSGRRVALIEAGGFENSAASAAMYEGETTGLDPSYLTRTRLRTFGGTTGHWGGYCRPLDAIDFEARPWVPDSVGWPFDKTHLEPYYDRAAALTEIDPLYAAAATPETRNLINDNCALNALLFRFSPPTRFGTRYREDIVGSRDVTLFLHSPAIDLRLDESGRRASELRIRRADGDFTVRARQFVLALGGLENPRFLLNCTTDQAAGLGNQNDLVGRFFVSHAPTGALGSVVFSGRNSQRAMARLFEPRFSYIGIKPEVQRAEQLLNHGFAFYAYPAERLPDEVARMHDVIAAFERLFDGPTDPRSFVLVSVAEQAPNPACRIRLGDDVDALGQRKIHLDYRTTPLDRTSIKRSIDVLVREFGRHGIGRVRVNVDDESEIPFNPDDHHMGSTRMHPDPRRGVVDAESRVHGIDNLYVAGGSVFPSGGFGNPTISFIAMALRLADHLKGLEP